MSLGKQLLHQLHEADTSGFKKIADNVPMATRLRRINKVLSDMGRKYYDGVPLDSIFRVVEENGFQAIQEDGTPWDGLVLGRDATYHMDLVDISNTGIERNPNAKVQGTPARVRLNMTHHKMEQSGRYEVVAYVN